MNKTLDEIMLDVDAYADAAAAWKTTGDHVPHARAAVVKALREALTEPKVEPTGQCVDTLRLVAR